MRLNADMYKLNALELAPKLLGKNLCRVHDGKTIRLTITETECYLGESDTACHAHKGKTKRTAVMYEPGGLVYVYLCYGIHYMLNVVSGPKDHPEAVLIRGIENFDGPGKLTKALGIDKSLNGENLILSDKIWIEDGITKFEFTKLKRVGISYASENDQNKLWRFKIK